MIKRTRPNDASDGVAVLEMLLGVPKLCWW
jgi:hypothetical protein